MAKFTKESLAIALRLELLIRQNTAGMRYVPLGVVKPDTTYDYYAYITIYSLATGKDIGTISVKRDITDRDGEFTIMADVTGYEPCAAPLYRAKDRATGLRHGNFDESELELNEVISKIATYLNQLTDTVNKSQWRKRGDDLIRAIDGGNLVVQAYGGCYESRFEPTGEDSRGMVIPRSREANSSARFHKTPAGKKQARDFCDAWAHEPRQGSLMHGDLRRAEAKKAA